MTEKDYAEKYLKCSDVPVSDCYMGSHNCHTCAHCRKYDRNFRYFEHEYCTCAPKSKGQTAG